MRSSSDWRPAFRNRHIPHHCTHTHHSHHRPSPSLPNCQLHPACTPQDNKSDQRLYFQAIRQILHRRLIYPEPSTTTTVDNYATSAWWRSREWWVASFLPVILPHLASAALPSLSLSLDFQLTCLHALAPEMPLDRQARSPPQLELPVHLPKNRSTGNLELVGNQSEKARIRFSFDAGAAAAEYDHLTRSVTTDHQKRAGTSQDS